MAWKSSFGDSTAWEFLGLEIACFNGISFGILCLKISWFRVMAVPINHTNFYDGRDGMDRLSRGVAYGLHHGELRAQKAVMGEVRWGAYGKPGAWGWEIAKPRSERLKAKGSM